MTVCIAIIKCPIRSGLWGMPLDCHSGFSVWSPDTLVSDWNLHL